MIEKPKKERRFLKTLGKIGEILIQDVLLKVGSNLIKRIGGKKTLPSILILFISISLFAQYPANPNKQRLGFQTTADGLVWRGSLSDTASIQPTTNQNAWLIIDTINLKIYSFDFTSNVWGLVGGGTSGLTMPFDSITFNTAKDGTVGVGEVEYNDTQGSLIQGLKGGDVTNVIGQQLHQRVNNRTGATLAKGTVVYLSGSRGNKITVAKALGVTDAFSANTFGIVAENILNNQSGYVITEGLITNINTSALVEDSAVYLSPTVAGGLTSTKPQAPQHTVYIGVCVKSNVGSGELFVKIRNGQELDELHDVRISNPSNNASLYYKSSEGIWRDTTPTLLVSDTATMLANYATKAYADTSGRFYARQDFTNVSSSTLTWTQSDTLVVGGVNVVQVYRNGQILLPTQYTIPTNTSVVIGATAYKLGENYTVIFPRGGGAGSGGGSGSLTSISGGTGIIVNPNPITTTGTVSADTSFLFTQSDTLNLNLTSRFSLKLNAADTTSLSNRINAKGTGTVTSVGSGFGLLGGTITTTGTLRLDTTTIYARLQDSINVAIGGDTIKILKQEYQPALSSVLTWTITPKFPIQLKAYILVFRNGQLLNNDQYNLTDTNKITIVSTSFKVGANYTVATVSGIGSVGSAQAGNPVYPEAGIALSTGTTWASSIPNNSANWNTAYNDKINSLAVTGTTTKTITLTQQDGGTVSGNFSDNGTVTSIDMTVPTGLAISGQPITTSGTLALSYASGYAIPTDIKQNEWNTAYNDKINNAAFTGTDIKTLTLTQLDGGTLTPTFTDLQGVTGVTGGTGLTGGTITTTGTLAADTNFIVTRFDTSAMLLPYLRKADTASMLLPYFRDSDTSLLNLTNRFAAKLNLSDTLSMLSRYLRRADTTSMLLPYLRRADTTLMLTPYLRKSDTTNMLVPYFRDVDTTSLNLTSRFAAKQNILNGTGFVKASGSNITYDNSSYLTTSSAASTYLPLTGGTLTGTLNGTKLNLDSGIDVSGNFSTSYHTNVSALFRGYQVLVAPNTDYGQTRIHFPNRPVDVSFSIFGSGIRHKWAGSDARNSFLSLYTSNNDNLQIDALSIDALGNVGIMDTTPSYTLDVNGTLGVTGASTFISTSRFVGNVAINTTTAYKPLEVHSNANDFVSVGVIPLGTGQWSGIHFGYVEPNTEYRKSAIVFQRRDYTGGADASGSLHLLNVTQGQGSRSADLRDARLTIMNNGNVGINDTLPTSTLSVNGTLGVTGAVTLSSTLAVQGDITEAGNNVMTNLDTVSLSNRIYSKVSLTGNETINGIKTFGSQVNMSGQITISGSVSGTNRLLGKNTSNNGVGDITIGSGLNLTSDVLNVNSKITNINTSQYSITSTDLYIDNKNSSSTTIILPLAGLNVFRELKFKNSSTGALIANGNIIPLSGSGTTTTILPATNAKWCTLVSDGTDWIIMQSN